MVLLGHNGGFLPYQSHGPAARQVLIQAGNPSRQIDTWLVLLLARCSDNVGNCTDPWLAVDRALSVKVLEVKLHTRQTITPSID